MRMKASVYGGSKEAPTMGGGVEQKQSGRGWVCTLIRQHDSATGMGIREGGK